MKAEADPEKTLSRNHESLAVFYNPTKNPVVKLRNHLWPLVFTFRECMNRMSEIDMLWSGIYTLKELI